MTPVLLVQGTWAWGRNDGVQWWQSCSPFAAYLKTQDCTIIGTERPFIWNTNLDGLTLFHRKGKLHINWESAGSNLYCYLYPSLRPTGFDADHYVPIEDRNVIGHSHAMQVIAYACAEGLKINRLITIGSPVREDMRPTYQLARQNIGSWLHVHSDGSDRIQWFGELLDGHLGIVREQPYADINKLVAKVSHSRLLNEAASFRLWHENGLIQFLRGGECTK